MARQSYNDFNPRDFTASQLRQLLPRLARRANSRIYRIQKNNIGYHAYQIAEAFLKERGRSYYSIQPSSLSDAEIYAEAENIIEFLNSQSSTKSGVLAINNARIKAFAERGINISYDQAGNFFDFLSSELFKTLSMLVDSDTVVEDYSLALEQGFTEAEIMADYYNFTRSKSMTFEQINEERVRRMMYK